MSFQNCKVVSVDTVPSDYFAGEIERGNPLFPVSSSMLREFARCPSRWRAGYVAPDSDAKDWGSLFDCVALTPRQFEARYAVTPPIYTNEKKEVKPWNNNANVCKEWNASQDGKEIVKPDQVRQAHDAVARMMADDTIKAWFSACDRQVWVAGEWNDTASGLVIPVKCLLDFCPRTDTEFAACLGDLKSTRTAATMAWQRDCFSMGYYLQAAFNTALYEAATGEDRPKWCFILSESFPPWQPGKRMLHDEFLILGRSEIERMLSQYCACLKSGKWPGYDDTDEAAQGWSIVSPEPWMVTREQFAPHYDFGQEAKEAMEEAKDPAWAKA